MAAADANTVRDQVGQALSDIFGSGQPAQPFKSFVRGHPMAP
jgi:hypothetical protein